MTEARFSLGPLPDEIVERGTKLASNLLIFGRPVCDMTREELIAMLGLLVGGWLKRTRVRRE